MSSAGYSLRPCRACQRPKPRADEKNRQRNDKSGRGRHEAVNSDALPISLARAAEDGKGRHIRRKNGEEEHHLADRAVGEEKILCVIFAPPERDAADKGNQAEVKADD